MTPEDRALIRDYKGSALFNIVRPFCSDTKEKQDWPEIADRQAARIAAALARALETERTPNVRP